MYHVVKNRLQSIPANMAEMRRSIAFPLAYVPCPSPLILVRIFSVSFLTNQSMINRVEIKIAQLNIRKLQQSANTTAANYVLPLCGASREISYQLQREPACACALRDSSLPSPCLIVQAQSKICYLFRVTSVCLSIS